jgi:hypothetical protein
MVINSPEECFGKTRQHAEVGHKNIISYGYENHLDRFCTVLVQKVAIT